jgi:hypothetical protein
VAVVVGLERRVAAASYERLGGTEREIGEAAVGVEAATEAPDVVIKGWGLENDKSTSSRVPDGVEWCGGGGPPRDVVSIWWKG